MRVRRWIAGLTAVSATAAASVAASPAAAGPPPVVQRLALTTAHARLAAGSAQLVMSQAPPALALPRRARVTFTVPRKTLLLPLFLSLPPGAGRYAAFYFPESAQGWALMPDTGSTRHWPAVVDLGDGGFATLYPHHVYTVFVALDRAARIQMPVSMHVVKVSAVAFAADVVVHQVTLQTPVSFATVDWTADTVGRYELSTTAVALDWDNNPAPINDTQGDACHSSTQLPSCSGGDTVTYTRWTEELGGGPEQIVMGEGYDRPEPAAYISGYASNLPAPFNAATLYGFGLNPPA